MNRPFALLSLTLLCLTVALPAWAQTRTTLVPADASFTLVTNPSKVMQSRLGQTILDRIRIEEPQVDEMIDELSKTVGIDLRTSLGKTILFGTGYERRSFALVSDIGPTSGNISGLLLTAPGYDSSVYREKVIVHSLPSEDEAGHSDRIFCAMPKRPGTGPGTGSYYLVASFDPQRTRDMIDLTLDADAQLTPGGADNGTLIEAWFSGLPELVRVAEAGGPPSVVAEMVQRAHLSLIDSGDSVTSELTLTMVDSLRAQQVFELMRGGLAMLQLAAMAEPQAGPIAELGRMINIQHDPDGADVTAKFNCSYDRLEQLLEQLEGMHKKDNGGEKAGEKTANYLLNLGEQINRDEVTEDEAWAKIRTKYGPIDEGDILFIEHVLDLGGKVTAGEIPRGAAMQVTLQAIEEMEIELKD